MPGYGLSPECSSYVKYGTKIECQPCQHGITYSARHGIGKCVGCGICSDHQIVIRNCTSKSNSKCGDSCRSGFYYEELTGDCKPCSFCCSDGRNTVKDECKGMPFYKQCNANEISCQPKCLDDQYLVVTRKGANICENCKTCPIGSSLSPQCGSILESTDDIKCLECTEGKTFSDKPGKEPCKVCSMCSVGQKELIPCNLTHDRVCGQCDKGFYNVTSIECKPCSACCDDDYDVRVASCVAQNMPENKQCGYTQQAMCQQKNGKTIIHSKFPSIINVVAIGIGIITAIAVLVLCCYLTYRRCKGQPEEPQSHMDSITLENQTTHSSQDTLSFDKSDSKLLSSLLQHESDDVRKIYDRLDTKTSGLGCHYKAVALHYDLDIYQIARLEKHDEGPSKALIEWLETVKPELTVREFVTVVRKEAKRNDVANLLEAYDANYTN